VSSNLSAPLAPQVRIYDAREGRPSQYRRAESTTYLHVADAERAADFYRDERRHADLNVIFVHTPE
jgi:hypothetical protein